MKKLVSSKIVFVMMAGVLLGNQALARTSSTGASNEIKTVKSTEAIITDMQLINENNARFTLDFVTVFDSYFEGEYERYLKLGYPKMSQEAFEETGSGSGFSVINNNKKLRTFTTNKDTVFKAHCLSAPDADENRQVELTATEFSYVMNKDNATKSEWKKLHEKTNGCYSQNGELVNISYVNNIITSIEFVWMP